MVKNAAASPVVNMYNDDRRVGPRPTALSEETTSTCFIDLYRASYALRGICYGRLSVCACVSVSHKSEFY